ncbi:MAG: hypothetical protein DCC71_02945 [Proteobacteria bacterium]|nr:MAG: hypothetical protein DCC71_02945 [Pseudomonadota bacterium]
MSEAKSDRFRRRPFHREPAPEAVRERAPYVPPPAIPSERVTRPAFEPANPESARVERPAFERDQGGAAPDREAAIRESIRRARRE